MSKGALIDSVFKQHSLSNKTGKAISRAAVGRLVDSVFEHAGKQIVSTGYFRYPGFGSFSIKNLKERTAYKQLPKTKGQPMDRSDANKMTVPARGAVGFKPASSLKASVKGLKKVPRVKNTRPSANKEKEIA